MKTQTEQATATQRPWKVGTDFDGNIVIESGTVCIAQIGYPLPASEADAALIVEAVNQHAALRAVAEAAACFNVISNAENLTLGQKGALYELRNALAALKELEYK